MSLTITMEVLEFVGGGLLLLAVAYVVLRRALNVTIASWWAQVPQLVGQATGAVQLPKFKLMDVVGNAAQGILSDPSVKQAIAAKIKEAISGLGQSLQQPPGGKPPG